VITLKRYKNTVFRQRFINPIKNMSAIRKHSVRSGCFEDKLNKIVSENRSLINWGTTIANMTTLLVRNSDAFCNTVLPSYFRHSKFSSFVRQLNSHGYVKSKNSAKGNRNSVDNLVWEFVLVHSQPPIPHAFPTQLLSTAFSVMENERFPPITHSLPSQKLSPVFSPIENEKFFESMVSPVASPATLFPPALLTGYTLPLPAFDSYPSPDSPQISNFPRSPMMEVMPVFEDLVYEDPSSFAPLFNGEFNGFR
jgi:hypothetical protein